MTTVVKGNPPDEGRFFGPPEKEEPKARISLAYREPEWGREGYYERNRKARELRSKGYKVETETLWTTERPEDRIYILDARLAGLPDSEIVVKTFAVGRRGVDKDETS